MEEYWVVVPRPLFAFVATIGLPVDNQSADSFGPS